MTDRDRLGKLAVYRAASANDITSVSELLQKGANSNFSDSGGVTPLHIAAWKNNVELI